MKDSWWENRLATEDTESTEKTIAKRETRNMDYQKPRSLFMFYRFSSVSSVSSVA